jgi:hypothetical protein
VPCVYKKPSLRAFNCSSIGMACPLLISMYEPLEVTKCKKCGKVIAGSKELIRIAKS